ncbi:MAG: hypothetical protein BRC26_01340 [Nanohaloarchaea archaeon QH_8_44_6]|nr:MAG: hypothetical protein BRC26_01340 [Nanohaloarchaea archaeon QH_8_44_6]
MKLLKISNQEHAELDEYFDEVKSANLDKVSPEVKENKADVEVDGESIDGFDAVFADIPAENVTFGRIFLEIAEEKGLSMNYPSTAYFVMSKKSYLYHVLHERSVSTPKIAVVGDERAARNLENHVKGPLIARKFEELSEVEKKKIDTVEDIGNFTEGIEYGEDFLLFQEYSAGDKYRCLVAGDSLISLEDVSDGWEIREDNLRYSNVPAEVKNVVLEAKNALGTKVAEVIVRNNQVVDVNPNPDLELYSEVSGKDVYKSVSETLQEEAA